jgi:hypothetical protein
MIPPLPTVATVGPRCPPGGAALFIRQRLRFPELTVGALGLKSGVTSERNVEGAPGRAHATTRGWERVRLHIQLNSP